jgi:hypothetical protein
MPVVTAIVVVVFGGATLILQDEQFIKIKPTIVYVLFGSVLLGGLAFGVLYENGEQLQRVALRTRRTAGGYVHLVELRPCPSTVESGFDGPALQLPLDGGGIEEHRAVFAHAFLTLRTPLAQHPHRVHPVHGKSESPEQPSGCHFGIDLPIFTPELHLHLVVRRDDTRELRGVAAHHFVAMRATDGFVGRAAVGRHAK